MSNSIVGALRVDLSLDSATFEEGMKRVERQLRTVSAKWQAVGQSMTQAGALMTAGITAPLAALGVQFARSAIDAEEMQSAFNVSFGAMASDVRSWAQETGDALGRSTFELQQMALGFNGLFKAGGPVTEMSADMARQFTVLAQDLASFHNEAEQDVFAALRSGLSGESEPLRRFNVYLTEAAVKAEAMRLGLGRAGAELSEQAKIQARASLILQATAEAQGDVARTSGSTANQLRSLNAQWSELSVTLGQVITPVIGPVVASLNGMLQSLGDLSPGMQTFVVGAAAVAAALGPLVLVAGAVVSSVGALIPVIGGASAALGAAMVPALAAIAPIAIPVGLAIAGLTAAVIIFRKELGQGLRFVARTAQETLGPSFRELFHEVAELARTVGGYFQDFIQSDAGQALMAFQRIYGAVLGEAFKRTFRGVMEVVKTVVDAIVIALRSLNALLKGDVSGAWQGLRDLVGRVFQGILNVIGAVAPEAVAWIRRMVEGIRDWLVNRFQTTVVEPVRRKIEQVKGFFEDLYVAVVGNSYIPDMVQGVASWMARLDAGMVQPARNATDRTKAAFESLRDDVAVIMEGLLTESERRMRELEQRIATLRRGMNAGILTQQQGNAAMGAVRDQYITPHNPNEAIGAVPGARDIDPDAMARAQEALSGIRQSGQQMGEAMRQAMAGVSDAVGQLADGLIDLAVTGEGSLGDLLKSFVKTVAKIILQMLALYAVQMITGIPVGAMLGGVRGGGGGFGGGFGGGGFGSLPGFARGGSFTVPGSGTVDSQLVAFRATPGERVDISTPSQQRDGGRANIAVAVQASPYFDARVRQVAAPVAGMAYQKAVSDSRRIVPADLAYRQAHTRS